MIWKAPTRTFAELEKHHHVTKVPELCVVHDQLRRDFLGFHVVDLRCEEKRQSGVSRRMDKQSGQRYRAVVVGVSANREAGSG